MGALTAKQKAHRLSALIRHSVEVTAESLYEAGVVALSALRKAGWVEEHPGPAARLEIEVKEPSTIHTISVAPLQRWVSGSAKSPEERVRRDRMRQMLTALTVTGAGRTPTPGRNDR
jgi:hypothetical protein